MTAWDLILRAIGLFHLVGGVLVLRAIAAGAFVDIALAALSGGWRRRDGLRALLLSGGGVLTTLAGAALAVLDRFALPLMALNAVVQGVWLVFAGRAFPPEDDDDRLGRLRTKRAFVSYLVAIGVLAWAIESDRVVATAWPWLEGGLVVAGLGLAAWQIRVHRWPTDAPSQAAPADEPFIEPPPPKAVRLAPEIGCWPLWDADTGRNLDPHGLGLPDDLVTRIVDFESEVIEAIDPDHDEGAVIPDPAAVARFEPRAIALTRELGLIFGEDNVSWSLPTP